MLFSNYTPFSPLVFSNDDVEGRPFHVIVLRGTFAIEPDRPLRAVVEQDPVVLADAYRGEIGRSSLLVESDLAPFKPRADVFVEAIAHAPSGRPQPSWLVRAQIGTREKILRVTGPRRFRKGERGWTLGAPEPCLEVPLTYELAFGGAQVVDDVEQVDERNPVGRGFVRDERSFGGDEDPLGPQIEAPDAPVDRLGGDHRPEGLGPIARAWLPRRALAGTFDERWQRERWPALPLDFDFAHYNAAHPDLVYDGYLRGDEVVTLDGLDPRGSLQFSLPCFEIGATLREVSGDEVTVRCELDTLRIDVAARRASLTWRARAPRQKGALAEVRARMSGPADVVVEEDDG